MNRPLAGVLLLLSACTGTVDGGAAQPAIACDGVIGVARTPLARLTRSQYDHAVRELLGTDARPALAFAPDEHLGSFSVNSTSPVGGTNVRQYMDAAESLALEASADVEALLGCVARDRACVSGFIARFGRRAYRRALSDEEQARYLALYDAFGAPDGVRLVITAMLQSPHFLYHLELAEPSDAPGSVAEVPAMALASRLSFFLWDSIPDDALLDAAEAGELSDPELRRAQIERMLEDDRARDMLESFHRAWLDLDRLDGATRDPDLYPRFGADTTSAMMAETVDFTDYVYRRGEGDLHTLLTAGYGFPRGPLEAIEGAAADPSGAPVMLPAGERSGVLTLPAFLAAHAHVGQSSPVLRGRAIRERFFCQALRDPPPTVDATPPAIVPGLTTRERYAEHRTNPSCSSCHSLIDDLGFALENFDAIGAFRAEEEGHPIDVRGVITGSDVDGRIDGAVAMGETLASSTLVADCVTREWMRFALQRFESSLDDCTRERARRHLDEPGGLSEMLVEIGMSDALGHYVVPVPDTSAVPGGAP